MGKLVVKGDSLVVNDGSVQNLANAGRKSIFIQIESITVHNDAMGRPNYVFKMIPVDKAYLGKYPSVQLIFPKSVEKDNKAAKVLHDYILKANTEGNKNFEMFSAENENYIAWFKTWAKHDFICSDLSDNTYLELEFYQGKNGSYYPALRDNDFPIKIETETSL